MLGEKKNIPAINRRAVFAMRMLGAGAYGLQKFAHFMRLPAPVTQKAYDNINNKLLNATSVIADSCMKAAAKEEKDITGSSDIIVSGDGSWKTRGHSSLVGVCTVIGAESAKVIDIDVMSSFCKTCDSYKGKKTGNKYKKWMSEHSKSCQKNHSGSAGNMEVEGMKRIFQRSVTARGVRYLSYIGDGDSSTFLNIRDCQPYGRGTNIECVGHIQKRMGTRLRKLKKEKTV